MNQRFSLTKFIRVLILIIFLMNLLGYINIVFFIDLAIATEGVEKDLRMQLLKQWFWRSKQAVALSSRPKHSNHTRAYTAQVDSTRSHRPSGTHFAMKTLAGEHTHLSGFLLDLTSDMTATRPRLSFLFLLHPTNASSRLRCDLGHSHSNRTALWTSPMSLLVSTVPVPGPFIYPPNSSLLLYCCKRSQSRRSKQIHA